MSEFGSALGIGRRIVISGMAGAGKSTFAKQLSAKTGLPVIHLDVHFWKPGWVAPSDSEWREVQSTLLAGAEWIADGNYHETLDLRLERADTVVYLDTPWWLCAARAFVRGLRRPKGTQMPDGCEESGWRRLLDEWWLMWRVWLGRRSERERDLAMVARHGNHVALHILHSKRAARQFLDASSFSCRDTSHQTKLRGSKPTALSLAEAGASRQVLYYGVSDSAISNNSSKDRKSDGMFV